jgi:hypothetical protein
MLLTRNATQPATVATATLTSGSAAVVVADTSPIAGALRVRGTGIPPGALVLSIDSATGFTMSAPATSSGPVTLTFAVEPVTLAQAKKQNRITFTQDDDLIADSIQAAREVCETAVSRSFLPTAWIMTLESFPGYRPVFSSSLQSIERPLGLTTDPIILPRAPVSVVAQVSYLDPNGSTNVLDPSLYRLELGDGTRIYPAYGRTWPSARATPAAVRVDFTAGYASVDAVPPCVKHAIKIGTTQLYVSRETSETLADAVRPILGPAYWGYTP